MQKYLFTFLFVSFSALATDYSGFQNFDDVISLGFGMQRDASTGVDGLSNNSSNFNTYSIQAQRLLNNGIYIDTSASISSSPNADINSAIISYYGLNSKLGYAFQVANDNLLLTPYLYAGINNNGLMSYNNQVGAVKTNSSFSGLFFYSLGFGERIEYKINDSILVYVDQNFLYNLDQSQTIPGTEPQNFNSFITSYGAKFNFVKYLQVGIMGFYTNYQAQASNVPIGGSTSLVISQPQSSCGTMLTLGLTY